MKESKTISLTVGELRMALEHMADDDKIYFKTCSVSGEENTLTNPEITICVAPSKDGGSDQWCDIFFDDPNDDPAKPREALAWITEALQRPSEVDL